MRVAPRPREVLRDIQHLRGVLARLETEYRWAHELAYGLASVGDSPTRAVGPSNPTMNSAADPARPRERARRSCRAAVKDLKMATELVEGAVGGLQRALGSKRRGAELEDREEDARLVTGKELAESRLAASRRAARGEGFGEA